MILYNSNQNKKLEVKPLNKNNIKMYVCGPTVYDSSHLGHARSAITFDLLHRTLLSNNYDVTMVKNFTDIDDKILKKMKDSGDTLESITNKYISEYKNDMETLNMLPNTFELKATDNIENMIQFIDTLIKKGSAYKIDDGIYFDTQTYKEYGSLFNKLSEDTREGIEKNNQKRNERDFALWKFDLNSEIIFETPFGKGRPGWHTECSVMINEHLAYEDGEYQIDIHGGGADLQFPHHENEEAQTFMHSGQKLAKSWVHNGFVTINGEKMSKSLGNSFYLKDILREYNPEVVRSYLMSIHYRSNFDFNEVDLNNSKKRLDKLYRLKKRVYNVNANKILNTTYEKIQGDLRDDLNTSKAMATLDSFINQANDLLDKDFKKHSKMIKSSLLSLDDILGLGYQDPYKYFQFGIDKETIDIINNKINERNQAKIDKDYDKADSIRKELLSQNISIMDTPNGTIWEKKEKELDFQEREL